MKETLSRRIFVVFNAIFLTLLAFTMFIPYMKIFAESLSDARAVDMGQVILWPVGFTFENYQLVFRDPSISRAFFNSVFVTAVGTLWNLLMTSMLAYPLSRPEFLLKRIILIMVTINMVFSAPLIPTYLLIKNLGLIDKIWVLILPGAISAFNLFILRSFFRSIPGELIDSARIDGCGEMRILLQIVLPLSKAALSSIGLFYAVGHWNSFFGPLMYINKPQLITLQVKLNRLLVQAVNDIPGADMTTMSPVAIKMTTIVVTTIPILLIYPFLQKHFMKGATLGSVKE